MGILWERQFNQSMVGIPRVIHGMLHYTLYHYTLYHYSLLSPSTVHSPGWGPERRARAWCSHWTSFSLQTRSWDQEILRSFKYSYYLLLTNIVLKYEDKNFSLDLLKMLQLSFHFIAICSSIFYSSHYTLYLHYGSEIYNI